MAKRIRPTADSAHTLPKPSDRWDIKGFRIALECQSLGSYFTDPQNTSKYDGFTVFNARAGYTFKHFETWINLINVTNQNYAVTVEKSAYGTSYRPGQLITSNVGVAYHFGKQ